MHVHDSMMSTIRAGTRIVPNNYDLQEYVFQCTQQLWITTGWKSVKMSHHQELVHTFLSACGNGQPPPAF